MILRNLPTPELLDHKCVPLKSFCMPPSGLFQRFPTPANWDLALLPMLALKKKNLNHAFALLFSVTVLNCLLYLRFYSDRKSFVYMHIFHRKKICLFPF